MKADLIEKAYAVAKERFLAIGVDTDAVLARMSKPRLPLAILPEDGNLADRDFVASLVAGKGEIVPEESPDGAMADAVKGLTDTVASCSSVDARLARIWASVIMARRLQRNELQAQLEPKEKFGEYGDGGPRFERLALTDEVRWMPFGAVFDYFNLTHNVPVGEEYIQCIQKYEKELTSK